jgi:hypothetical protein
MFSTQNNLQKGIAEKKRFKNKIKNDSLPKLLRIKLPTCEK